VPTISPPTILPEDKTYHRGSHWFPKDVRTRDGIIAPEDKYYPSDVAAPDNSGYPLLAPMNKFAPLPEESPKDRLPYKFSKYIDQLWDRTHICDKVSKDCTIKCEKGHNVTITLGNTVFEGRVLGPTEGDQLVVRYAAEAALNCGNKCPKGELHCKTEDGCSGFRPCLQMKMGYKGVPVSAGCVAMEDSSSFNFKGDLIRKESCPGNTKMCSDVEQVLPADAMTLDGRPCRAQ
jgi:hypothetical protein